MAWLGNTNRAFTTVADTLIAENADDSTLHDVLAALMDHVGVPMMLAERYRGVPAIRALFAERGVTLLDPGAERCPRCDSPAPNLHPAVQPCPDSWHDSARREIQPASRPTPKLGA